MKTLFVTLIFVLANHANAQHQCTVSEVAASKGGAPAIDKTLPPKLKKVFKSPEFSRWNVFKKVGVHQMTFNLLDSQTASLSKGDKLKAVLTDVTKRPGKKSRFTISAIATNAKNKRLWSTTIKLDKGRFFYITKQSGRILAVRCL